MPGALSTLGLGSSGVLTNDILDQLKKADKNSTIDPITKKQENLSQKKEALAEIKTIFSDLTTLSTSLTDIALYRNKASELSGDSVSVSVTDKAIAQDLDINVSKLATRDIHTSTGQITKDSALNADSFSLAVGGKSFDINISSSDSLEDIMKNINDNTDGKVTASILNVGGDNPYQLVLKGAETGTSNAITVTPAGDTTKTDLGIARLGDAPIDAELTVDGIAITSSSNTLDDLLEGASITLEKTGSTTVSITNDNEQIVEKMGEFVEKYNGLLEKITTSTKYDSATKSAGVLQDSREIKSIASTLTNIINASLSESGKSIEDFGLSTARDGTLSLSEDKLKESLKDSNAEIEEFFVGADAQSGVFSKLDSAFFDINTSSTGILKTLKSNYSDKEKLLTSSLEKAQARLDSKYAIMQKQFAAYDAVIGRLSSSSDMLTSMIDAQYAKN